jgi:hypothetical protein
VAKTIFIGPCTNIHRHPETIATVVGIPFCFCDRTLGFLYPLKCVGKGMEGFLQGQSRDTAAAQGNIRPAFRKRS